MKRAEDALQRGIVEYLRLVLPAKDYRVFAIPNGGGRSKIEAAIMKGTGTLAGVPDVMILAGGGRCWFIECKVGRNGLSDAQRDFQNFCIARGVPMMIARTLDDVKTALEQWRLTTREAA